MKTATLLLLMLISPLLKAATEADYVRQWCTGEIEHVLPDRARVDCLLPEHAVEADYAKKWAEAIGQSLYYASQTGRRPGILLIVEPGDWRYIERLSEAIAHSGRHIRVWYVDKIHDTPQSAAPAAP